MEQNNLEQRCKFFYKVRIKIWKEMEREFYLCTKNSLNINHPTARKSCIHQSFQYITDPETKQIYPQCLKWI